MGIPVKCEKYQNVFLLVVKLYTEWHRRRRIGHMLVRDAVICSIISRLVVRFGLLPESYDLIIRQLEGLRDLGNFQRGLYRYAYQEDDKRNDPACCKFSNGECHFVSPNVPFTGRAKNRDSRRRTKKVE